MTSTGSWRRFRYPRGSRIKQGDLSVEVRKVAGEVFEVLVIAYTAYHSAYGACNGALLPLCLV